MKLLKDACLYCIKVNYYMIDSEENEYEEPLYLSIDTEKKRKDGTPANIIIFEETITPHLRVFDTEKEAQEYINQKGVNTCCYEKGRVIKIIYNCENGKWEEC